MHGAVYTQGVLYKIVTSSKSRFSSDGLTYEGPDGLMPGTHVKVPLRNSIIEGIVSEILAKRDEHTFDLKQIKEILGNQPIIPEAQLRTARWMSNFYLCTF